MTYDIVGSILARWDEGEIPPKYGRERPVLYDGARRPAPQGRALLRWAWGLPNDGPKTPE